MAYRYDRASSSRSPSMSGLSNRQANDRRLRQAIKYLIDEGGTHSDGQYEEAIRRINDTILSQYVEEGYSYDPKLYRQLRGLVEAELGDTLDASEDNSPDSDSVEEILREDGLYKEDTPEEEILPIEEPRPRPKAPAKSTAHPALPPPAAPLPKKPQPVDSTEYEKQWKYGGPKNEYEHWHKNFPAALPFGETLYMQEYESLKISYDLAESAKKKGSKDPIVHTDVPISAVSITQEKQYDSGSRFKLPTPDAGYLRFLRARGKTLFNLDKEVAEFNSPNLQEQLHKDYTPRVFLDFVATNPTHRNSIPVPDPPPKSPVATRSRAASTGTAVPSRTQPNTVGSGRPRSDPPRSRTTAIARARDELSEAIRAEARTRTPSAISAGPSRPARAATPYQAVRSNLEDDMGWVDPLGGAKARNPIYDGGRKRPGRSTAAKPTTAAGLAPRPRGRPKKDALPVPQAAPKSRPTKVTAAVSKGKRKADSMTEAPGVTMLKRAKTGKAKKVAFTGRDEYEGTPSPVAPVTPSPVAPLRRPSLVPPKGGVAAQGYERVKRGTTRSGAAFKK